MTFSRSGRRSPRSRAKQREVNAHDALLQRLYWLRQGKIVRLAVFRDRPRSSRSRGAVGAKTSTPTPEPAGYCAGRCPTVAQQSSRSCLHLSRAVTHFSRSRTHFFSPSCSGTAFTSSQGPSAGSPDCSWLADNVFPTGDRSAYLLVVCVLVALVGLVWGIPAARRRRRSSRPHADS